jgi:hypothetical protein
MKSEYMMPGLRRSKSYPVEPNDKNKWLSLAGSINAVDNVFEPIDKL